MRRSVDHLGMVTDASNGNGAVWIAVERSSYSAVIVKRDTRGGFTVRVVNADTVSIPRGK